MDQIGIIKLCLEQVPRGGEGIKYRHKITWSQDINGILKLS